MLTNSRFNNKIRIESLNLRVYFRVHAYIITRWVNNLFTFLRCLAYNETRRR